MADKYLLNSAVGEYEEKKSKFIAHIKNISSEEEAAEVIAGYKKEYWDARHNCYAYVLGEKNEIQRFSDDGEPGGTAGKPILDVLEGSGLRNVLIVVTRYFGGVLLGTGGLVRAYRNAAADAVEKSEIAEKMSGKKVEMILPYTLVGKLQYICATMGIHELSSSYEDKVKMCYLVPVEYYGKFCEEVNEAASASVEINELDEVFYVVCESGQVMEL